MNLIDDVIINSILTLFPILFYIMYSTYKNNSKKDNIYLSICLITSIYLCFKYGITSINEMSLLFCNIPIVVSYIKKNENLAIILSLLVILYYFYALDYNYIILVLKYLTYYIIYKINKNKKYDDGIFINLIAIIQGFFLSFEYFFYNHTINNVNNIINLFILVLIFYIVSFCIIRLFKFFNEIKDLYNIKRKLKEQEKVKNALFKLTHEIKNPLAVCKGYLDMFNYDDKTKIIKYTNILKQEIDRSLNIMNDFLELNRIRIKKELVDINLLLSEVYDSLNIGLAEKNITLEYKNRNKEELIECDYNRIKQVLINIIKNSIESTNELGIVKIKTKINNNNFYIEIKDNGIGMDKEELSKIKEIFWTTKSNGNGLGVSLSNEIIKAHDGELNYYSTKGKGTTTQIILPIK